MEATTNSGKRIHGRIAEILVRKGRATAVEETNGEQDKTPAPQPKAPKKVVKKKKAKK